MHNNTATEILKNLTYYININAYENFKFSGTINEFIDSFSDCIFFDASDLSDLNSLRQIGTKNIVLRAYYSKSEQQPAVSVYIAD